MMLYLSWFCRSSNPDSLLLHCKVVWTLPFNVIVFTYLNGSISEFCYSLFVSYRIDTCVFYVCFEYTISLDTVPYFENIFCKFRHSRPIAVDTIIARFSFLTKKNKQFSSFCALSKGDIKQTQISILIVFSVYGSQSISVTH